MNKDIITNLLKEKLAVKMAEVKKQIAEKVIKESTELQEDHFSEDELENILAKFEKEMNHEGAKAVEDYIDAEASGNKGKAAQAAAKIKKAMK